MATWHPLFEQQANISSLFSAEGLVCALSLSAEAFCGCNAKGDILLANKAFSHLCGLSMPQLMNTNLKVLLYAPHSKGGPTELLPQLADGSLHSLFMRRPKNDETIPVRIKANTVGKEENNYILLVSPAKPDAVPKGSVPDPLEALQASSIRETHDSRAAQYSSTKTIELSNLTEVAEPSAENNAKEVQESFSGNSHNSAAPESFSGNSRILDELIKAVGSGDSSGIYSVLSSELMGATGAEGAAVYVADRSGYRRKGYKGVLNETNLPSYLPKDDPLALLATDSQSTIRYNLLKETKSSVSANGTKTFRAATSTGIQKEPVITDIAPSLDSFYIVPVIFDGTIVAFTLVGWKGKKDLSAQSARVLDLLSSHYADELVTASVSMQSSTSEAIQQSGEAIWTTLQNQKGTFIESDIQKLFHNYAKVLDAQYIAFYKNDEADTHTAVVNEKEFHVIDFSLADLYREAVQQHHISDFDTPEEESTEEDFTKDERANKAVRNMIDAFEQSLSDVRVLPFSKGSIVSLWTESVFKKPLVGAVFVIPNILGKRHAVAIGHYIDEEPLSNIELTLYKRFLQDACLFVRDKNRAAQDIYVSKILQAGLENKIQNVEGLTIKPLYNSATQAAEVGGDFYDVIALPNHKACIIMGDVAGKGVESAAVSSAVRTALGAYAWEGLMPAHMVRSLNDFFLGFSRLETFATLFVGILNTKTGVLTYCSAGHPPAVLIRPSTGKIELLNKQSGVVGAFREIIYENGSVQLRPKDKLFLYTDGVIEARKPSTGEFFGELSLHDVLLHNVNKSSDELPDIVLSELYSFSENNLDDDVAIMCISFDGYTS